MRRYGSPKRTKADKRAAAMAFVIMANKSEAEKIDSLVRSYGFSESDARALVRKHAA